jgi:hypothetical protein
MIHSPAACRRNSKFQFASVTANLVCSLAVPSNDCQFGMGWTRATLSAGALPKPDHRERPTVSCRFSELLPDDSAGGGG